MKKYLYIWLGFVCIVGLIVTATHKSPQENYLEQATKRLPLILELRGSAVKVKDGQGGGTGFYVETKSGKVIIITNAHVCGASTEFKIEQKNNVLGSGMKLKQNYSKDFCAVSSPKKPEVIPSLNKHSVDDAPVFTIGYPFSRDLSVSEGYALNKRVAPITFPGMSPDDCNANGGLFEIGYTMYGMMNMCTLKQEVIYSTLKVYPGASGSPVFDSNGYIVGVVQSYDYQTNNGQFLPVESLLEFLGDL